MCSEIESNPIKQKNKEEQVIMWEEGELEINGNIYYYEAKVYDDPSDYGINGSRVSKLVVSDTPHFGINDAILSYDRGWDIEPENDEDDLIIEKILEIFA